MGGSLAGRIGRADTIYGYYHKNKEKFAEEAAGTSIKERAKHDGIQKIISAI